MTAIEKMVEWADKYKLEHGRYPSACYIMVEARRLAAEEKEQKPTAPASLVEEIKTYCENIAGPRQDGSATIKAQCFNEGAKVAGLEVLKILSRHRPAPDRTAELVKRVKEAIRGTAGVRSIPEWDLVIEITKILADFEKEEI